MSDVHMTDDNVLSKIDNKNYLKSLESEYTFSYCMTNELDDLLLFLRDHWRSDHIFLKCKELLDWQYLDKKNKRYNFVIARNKMNNEIHHILGFVPSSQYDDSIINPIVWICIWKTREDISVKGLGSACVRFLKDKFCVYSFCSLAISETALGIYRHWGFHTGKINQYYIVNNNMVSFNLIQNFDAIKNEMGVANNFIIKQINLEAFKELSELFINRDTQPVKTIPYYINRFFKHPLYNYSCHAIYNRNNNIVAAFFSRICEAKGKRAIRIVDFIGEIGLCNGAGEALQKLLCDTQAEYIDFLNVGYNEKELTLMGFTLKKEDGNVVIPHLFEPFIHANVSLDYSFGTISNKQKFIIVKGDGDLDRPNQIPRGNN